MTTYWRNFQSYRPRTHYICSALKCIAYYRHRPACKWKKFYKDFFCVCVCVCVLYVRACVVRTLQDLSQTMSTVGAANSSAGAYMYIHLCMCTVLYYTYTVYVYYVYITVKSAVVRTANSTFQLYDAVYNILHNTLHIQTYLKKSCFQPRLFKRSNT